MLRARLYEAEMQRRETEASATEASKTEIGWGHQIRSYVLQPYQMVKDLRTGHTSGTPDDVARTASSIPSWRRRLPSASTAGGPGEIEDVD